MLKDRNFVQSTDRVLRIISFRGLYTAIDSSENSLCGDTFGEFPRENTSNNVLILFE